MTPDTATAWPDTARDAPAAAPTTRPGGGHMQARALDSADDTISPAEWSAPVSVDARHGTNRRRPLDDADQMASVARGMVGKRLRYLELVE